VENTGDSARVEITGVKNVEADWIMLRCKSVRKARRFVTAGDQSELYRYIYNNFRNQFNVSGVTSVATSIFTYITVLAPLDKLSHCST